MNYIAAFMLLAVFVALLLDMLQRERDRKEHEKLSIIQAERDMYKKRYKLLAAEVVKHSGLVSAINSQLKNKYEEVKGETQKS